MDSPQVQERPSAPAHPVELPAAIRVLLIDDDEDAYVIVRNQLAETDGARIGLDWVSSFEVGLHAMCWGKYDAYLVDYRLEARDGLELMRQAKADGCVAPIIILTGQGDHSIDLRAMKEGAADYLVKGQSDGRAIERSLRFAVERRRAEEVRMRHEAQLQVLIEQMPAILWTTDAQLRVTSSTGAGLRELNLQPNQFTCQTLFEVFATTDENHVMIAAHRRALAGESVFAEDEFRGRTYHSHVNPLRLESGRIAGTVGVALDVTEERHVQEELRAAARVQAAFLPKAAPRVPGFDLAGVCHPANTTGGDYYDYFRLPDGSLGLVIADVSGHDFGTAMIMADTCRLMRMLAKQHTDPGVILTAANRALAEDTSSGYFVTAFLARLDTNTRSLTYAAAGHDGFVLDTSGTVQYLPSTSLPLGIDEAAVVPCSAPITLASGGAMLLFTDGFSDALAPDGKMFGTARVLEFVREHASQPAHAILDELYGTIQAYCQPDRHHDDATAVLLKVLV